MKKECDKDCKIGYDEFLKEFGFEKAKAKGLISEGDLKAMYEAYIDDNSTEN